MKNNFYISFAFWLMLLPFLGVPSLWRMWLTFFSGLFLVLVSLGSILLHKSQLKSRSKRRQQENLNERQNSESGLGPKNFPEINEN